EEAQKRFQALHTVASCEPSEVLIRTTLAKVGSHSDRQRVLRRRWFRGALAAAAAVVFALAGMHLYYLNLEASPFDLRVLGQRELLSGARGSLRVQLVNRATGAAVAGVPVEIELRGRQQEEVVRLASFTTNSAGTGQ